MASKGLDQVPRVVRDNFHRMLTSIPGAVFDVADKVVAQIRLRTAAGVSEHGVPFAGYTDKYATRKGVPMVNLRGSAATSKHGGAHMMSQLHTRKGEGMRYNVSAERFIPAANSGTFLPFDDVNIEIRMGAQASGRAFKHKFGYPKQNIPPRPFMGLAPSEQGIVGEVLKRKIKTPPNTKTEVLFKFSIR